MNNKICISSTLVFPPKVEYNLKNNLLAQLSMMLTFLSHYQNEVHTVLVSNDIKIITNLLLEKGFEYFFSFHSVSKRTVLQHYVST